MVNLKTILVILMAKIIWLIGKSVKPHKKMHLMRDSDIELHSQFHNLNTKKTPFAIFAISQNLFLFA